MREFAASLADLWVAGGFVMPWLVAATALLWFAIGERALQLRRGAKGTLAEAVAARVAGRAERQGVVGEAIARALALPPTQRTDERLREAFADLAEGIARHRVLIRSVAATAPLVGLLGTVTGMIETFDALTTMSFYRGSGGIAGGISAALVSTQMGLAVAIPGLLAGRLLERREQRLREELDALGDLVRVRATGETWH